MKLQRRVYRRELREALGFSDEWFRQMQQRGRIPKGRRDPGGTREWFTECEASKIIKSLNAQAARA